MSPGRITLLPPENAPRIGVPSSERSQSKGKQKKTNALAPELSASTSISPGSARTVVDYTIPSRPRLKQVASVPDKYTRGESVRSERRRPASSASTQVRSSHNDHLESSEIIASSFGPSACLKFQPAVHEFSSQSGHLIDQ